MRASLTAALVLVGAASSVWLLSCANPETCSVNGYACRVDNAWPEAMGQRILEGCNGEADSTWGRHWCYALGDGGGPDNCLPPPGFNVVCASGFCVCR